MIDRTAFLADAQKLVAKLEKDLRTRCDDMPDVGRAVEAEYRRAKDAGRTGQTLEEWRADAITQQATRLGPQLLQPGRPEGAGPAGRAGAHPGGGAVRRLRLAPVPPDRLAARTLLENQCSELRQRVKHHLEAAYGLDSLLPGSLDTTQELEPHEQFASLKNGFDPQPPAAANLRGALEGLLDLAVEGGPSLSTGLAEARDAVRRRDQARREPRRLERVEDGPASGPLAGRSGLGRPPFAGGGGP